MECTNIITIKATAESIIPKLYNQFTLNIFNKAPFKMEVLTTPIYMKSWKMATYEELPVFLIIYAPTNISMIGSISPYSILVISSVRIFLGWKKLNLKLYDI